MSRKINLCKVCMVLSIALASCSCDGSTSPADSDSNESSQLQVSWSYGFDAVGTTRTPPEIVGDSLVLLSAEGRLVSLRIPDGVLKWKGDRFDSDAELHSEGLVVKDQAIYGSHIHQARAWNLEDGRELWQFASSSDQFFYDGGYYGAGPDYFYGSDGSLLAFSKRGGEVAHEWEYEYGPRGIAYHSGALYFTQAWTPEGAEGQSKGGVMKIDAASGDSIWNYRTERGGFYRMRPVVEKETVYAGTRGGDSTEFVSLDAETGEVLWRNKEARVYAAEMAAGRIYVNTGRDVMALDKETGETLWHAGLEAGHGESGLAYLKGYVYHPHGRGLRVIDAETGEVVHVEWPENGYFWEVGVGAGKVFAQDSGALYAFEPYSPE